MILEIAVDTLSDALAASGAGADRLEVCDRLDLGGLTPPMELIRTIAARTEIPLFVMIRPRGGDFVCAPSEFAEMERHIDLAGEAGAQGFVFGLLHPDGRMDLDRTHRLIQRAAPLPATIHRAFDRCPDLHATAEALADLGAKRILTSGGCASAEAGSDVLQGLQKRLGRKIGILPGGGVRPVNIQSLVRKIGVNEMHSAARNDQGVFDERLVRTMKREMERAFLTGDATRP